MRGTNKAPKCTGSGRRVVILTQAISRVVFFRHPCRKIMAFFRATVCTFLVVMLASPQLAGANNTIVRMVTNVGSFNVELYDTEAPITVANFLQYLNGGFYNGTVFHRSIPGFALQGGGYVFVDFFGTRYFYEFDKFPPIQNEFSPSRSNIRGTLAMAKLGGDPNSATSEWFINLADNGGSPDTDPPGLDYQNGGFTVFGRVLEPGMKVVDTIADPDKVIATNVQIMGGAPRFFPALPVVDKIDKYPVVFNKICINNDSDGACPEIEDLAPRGDGNGDGIPDRDQANVTTVQTLLGATATFEAEPMMRLDPVNAVNTPTATSLLTMFKSPSDQSVHFNNGMYTFSITGVIDPAGNIVTMYDGASARPTHYYAFGPTSDNLVPHWYDFAFDGETGAEIKSDSIMLHFVDGKRGDYDLTVNGNIDHIGAQAVVTAVDNGSASGGGCSIAGTPPDVTRGGDWIVVSLFLAALVVVRRRARSGRRQDAQGGKDTNIASP